MTRRIKILFLHPIRRWLIRRRSPQATLDFINGCHCPRLSKDKLAAAIERAESERAAVLNLLPLSAREPRDGVASIDLRLKARIERPSGRT